MNKNDIWPLTQFIYKIDLGIENNKKWRIGLDKSEKSLFSLFDWSDFR